MGSALCEIDGCCFGYPVASMLVIIIIVVVLFERPISTLEEPLFLFLGNDALVL